MKVNDNILSLINKTPDSIQSSMAERVKQRQLDNAWSQKTLATKAGSILIM